MYQKIKIILFMNLFIVATTMSIDAQIDTVASDTSYIKQDVKGEIVISRSELVNFLKRVAEARKEKLQDDLERSKMQYTRSNYNVSNVAANPYSQSPSMVPFGTSPPVQSMSRDDLVREIESLNSRFNSLLGYEVVGATRGGSSTTFITAPSGTQGRGYYPYQTQIPLMSLPTKNEELRWKIDSLERRVNRLSVPDSIVEKQDEIGRLNKEIGLVQDSLIASSALTPEAREIVKKYGTSVMRVYFDNDVSEVSPRYHDEVKRAATLLKKNYQLAAVLKGYASSSGGAKYNYDLSMRRNEAVKRMLIDYGVFPDQISSVFYGEDKNSSAREARRVEIKFIIK